MLIDYITDFCNTQYSEHTNCFSSPRCKQCNHPTAICSGDCGDCLCQIHFRPNDEKARHLYNCKNLTDFYVCRYSAKYTSELIYALRKCKFLKNAPMIKALSIGCGPCTDLFALDYLNCIREFTYNSISYVGVDLLEEQWEIIHERIKKYMFPNKIGFFYENASSLIDKMILSISLYTIFSKNSTFLNRWQYSRSEAE